MKDNVVKFPRTVEHTARDMDKIADKSVDLLERSEALLRIAEEMKWTIDLKSGKS